MLGRPACLGDVVCGLCGVGVRDVVIGQFVRVVLGLALCCRARPAALTERRQAPLTMSSSAVAAADKGG